VKDVSCDPVCRAAVLTLDHLFLPFHLSVLMKFMTSLEKYQALLREMISTLVIYFSFFQEGNSTSHITEKKCDLHHPSVGDGDERDGQSSDREASCFTTD